MELLSALVLTPELYPKAVLLFPVTRLANAAKPTPVLFDAVVTFDKA